MNLILIKIDNQMAHVYISVILILFSIQICTAQTTWNGLSSDWNTAANWSAGVPTDTDDVTIPVSTSIPIIQTGTMAVAKSITIEANATLVINPNAFLKIDGAAANAITSSGSIINYGSIDIGSTMPIGGNGIRTLSGSFNNSGMISINNTTGAAFTNINASCTNIAAAVIEIGNVGGISGYGIRNRSIFINSGNIDINNVGLTGILCELTSDFTHFPGGQIDVVNSTQHGVWNKGGSFTNNGSFYIANSGPTYAGFLNDADAMNDGCAIMYMNDNVKNNSTLTNDGLWVLTTSKPSTSSGTFTNNGILEDIENTIPSSQVINNELIIAKTILTTPATVIPNAFDLGAGSTFNIIGVYTDFSFTTLAGTYVNNDFTPMPALNYGLQSFALQIEDPTNGCFRSVQWRVDNQVCPSSSSADKIWIGDTNMYWTDPSNWCPSGAPTTGDWVDLGVDATVMYNEWIDITLSQLDMASGTTFTVMQSRQLHIDGALGNNQSSLLLNDGGNIINEGTILIENAPHNAIKSKSSPSASMINHGNIDVMSTDLNAMGSMAIEIAGSQNTWTNLNDSRIRIRNAEGGGMHITQQAELTNQKGACIDISETAVIGLSVSDQSSLVNEKEGIIRIFDLENSADYFACDLGSTLDWDYDINIGSQNSDNLKLRTEFGSTSTLELVTQGIFAIWWDPQFDHAADAQVLFQTLEFIREDCLTNLNMQDPPNPDAGYYFNIYIHHGANDQFPDGWANGVGTDVYGMPFFTVPYGLATDYNNTLHEGFHIFQYSGDSPGYVYSGPSGWYVEASAQWYVTIHNPNDDYIFFESLAKAQNPQLALWHFYYYTAPGDFTGWLWGIQPYGLQSYMYYLSVIKGVNTEIFTEGFYNNTSLSPQEYHYQQIGGNTLRGYFADWAAANTGGFDYMTAGQIAASEAEVAGFAAADPDQLHPFALELTDQGTNSTFTPTGNYKPRGWSYNVIKINNTQAATYTFDLAGASTGSEGAASHFEARLVTIGSGGVVTYDTVNMSDALNGTISKSVTASDTELYFVICAVADHFTGHQTYDYDLDISRL